MVYSTCCARPNVGNVRTHATNHESLLCIYYLFESKKDRDWTCLGGNKV
jgi:hypothetical protein